MAPEESTGMSRTDHHAPYRVRVTDPATPHRYAQHWHGVHGEFPCNLDDPPGPPRWRSVIAPRRNRAQEADCGWDLPYSHLCNPPRWWRHAEFYGPDRARVRTWGRNAARAYQSGDEIPEPPDGRHRNGAAWSWW